MTDNSEALLREIEARFRNWWENGRDQANHFAVLYPERYTFEAGYRAALTRQSSPATPVDGGVVLDGCEPDLTDQLLRLAVGGCTCETKAPELEYHRVGCVYRTAMRAYGAIKAKDARIDALSALPLPSPASDGEEGGQ